jgi:hypothetical protein
LSKRRFTQRYFAAQRERWTADLPPLTVGLERTTISPTITWNGGSIEPHLRACWRLTAA